MAPTETTTEDKKPAAPARKAKGAAPARKAKPAAPARKAKGDTPSRKTKPLTAEERAEIRKADKAAEAKRLEMENAAEKRAAEDILEKAAKEINVRLGKAAEIEKKAHDIEVKADDHRLAAALKLADAKEAAKIIGVPFKTWYEKNIDQTLAWESARKLAIVGAAPDPAKALADLREGTKARVAKARAEGKTKDSKPVNSFDKAEKALAGLDSKSSLSLTKRLAEEHGLALVAVDKDGVPVVPEEKASRKAPAASKTGMSDAKSAFQALPATEQAAFMEWAAAEIGGTFSM